LLLNVGGPQKRVVPQLAAVAGWLASFVPEVFDEIVKCDPHALLASDMEKLTDAERARVVDSFFELLNEERISLWGIGQRYAKLHHNNLHSQLRAIITDSNHDFLVRREAVRIAGACNLITLQDDLLAIALNPKEPGEVRAFAGFALTQMDDPSSLHNLLPLALGQAGDDPDDELRGMGLTGVYPKHLDTEQLFRILSPVKNESYYGTYHIFLSYTLFERMPEADIQIALKWVLKTDRRRSPQAAFRRDERFSDDVMWFAWQHLDMDSVIRPFGEAALARLLKHDQVVGGIHSKDFYNSLFEQNENRRLLIKTVVELAARKRKESVWNPAFAISRLVAADDFDWLVTELMLTRPGQRRQMLLQLASMSFSCRTDHLETLLVKGAREFDLQGQFEWLKKVWELDSLESQEEKNRHERLSGDGKRKLLEPPPADRVSSLLLRAENGEPLAWFHLLKELTLKPESTHYSDFTEHEVEDLPGWISADDSTRARLIAAAKKFLLDHTCDPKVQDWLCTSNFSWLAIAGVKALVLLRSKDPDGYNQLPDDVWARFFGVPLLYPDFGKEKQRINQLELLKAAYDRIPNVVTEAIVKRIAFDNSSAKRITIIKGVSKICDEALGNRLLKLLDDPSVCFEIKSQLLTLLLDSKSASARNWASKFLSNRTKSTDVEFAASMAAVLAMNWADEEWPNIWNAILEDGEFGDAVLNGAVSWWRKHDLIPKLTDEQLADLFIWMQERYPDPKKGNNDIVKFMGRADMLADLKQDIPNLLTNRGTLSASRSLSKIAQKFPNLVGVQSMLASCLAKFRRTSWVPYEPIYILRLADNAELRLIASEQELLTVIIESMERLQKQLKDHYATVEQLWNAVPNAYVIRKTGATSKSGEKGKKKYLPRDEEGLCNFVADHLRKDLSARGIIINREVQIRVNPGGKGERTDIQVDAVAKSESTAAFLGVTVVIEAKGLWNDGLHTDMETQLVEQYLTESHCQSGIYLVGYFNCSQWDDDDYRKGDSFKHGLETTKESLLKQARSLSVGGLNVMAFVLDASLRERPVQNSATKQSLKEP